MNVGLARYFQIFPRSVKNLSDSLSWQMSKSPISKSVTTVTNNGRWNTLAVDCNRFWHHYGIHHWPRLLRGWSNAVSISRCPDKVSCDCSLVWSVFNCTVFLSLDLMLARPDAIVGHSLGGSSWRWLPTGHKGAIRQVAASYGGYQFSTLG